MKYICIKDVVGRDGIVEFNKGATYCRSWHLTDNSGSETHCVGHVGNVVFDEHFIAAAEQKKPVKKKVPMLDIVCSGCGTGFRFMDDFCSKCGQKRDIR